MVGVYNNNGARAWDGYIKRRLLVLGVVASIISMGGGGVEGAAPLRALVPLKTSYKEFVSWSGSPLNASFSGFCVEVFKHAALRLPSGPLSYEFLPFGDGLTTSSYDEMILMLQQGKADLIVADITINKDRIKVVDFTQSFMPSVLIMATPFRYGRLATIWDFLRPFTIELWIAILFSFIGTGLVMFALEFGNPDFLQDAHQLKPGSDGKNDNDRPVQMPIHKSRFKKWAGKLVNFYWFSSLTLFFSQQESVMTHAGRVVTVVWLLVVLIFTSSYTASLASTLAAQQPSPTINRFELLLKSSVRIGYHGGSFIHNYLVTQLGIQEGRLRSLETEQQYADALRHRPAADGVGAIVDEQPYLQSFLNTECDFTAVGDQIAFFGGFGFAFAKEHSNVTSEMSSAILSLAEDGTLQMLKDKWVGQSQCTKSAQASANMKLTSFGGLFIMLAVAYVICVVWRVLALQIKSRLEKGHISGGVLPVESPEDETAQDLCHDVHAMA